MDHIKILKRALSLTLNYRALWVFGILLALTTASGNGGSSNGGSSSSGGSNGSGGSIPTPGFIPMPNIPIEVVNGLIAGAVILICVFVLLAIVGTFVHYVSETALIRMVDQHETTGEKATVRQGFRWGWSRPAARIFAIDLLFGLGGMVVFILLLLIAATPLLVWLVDNTPLRVLGTVLSIGLAVLLVFVAIVAAVTLSVLTQFFYRACTLENLGIFDGIRRGWTLARGRLGDVVVMGVMLIALGILWAIVLIPVVILLVAVALLVAALPALLVGSIAAIFTGNGPTPWIIGAITGVPLFILVLAAPMAILQGLAKTFTSSTWTLTYRELLALEPTSAPAPELPEIAAETPAA